jgi:ATP-binding cassette subfamily G (WHITE) protein 2 (SNQ2)
VGVFLKDGHFEKRTEAGESAKKVGVVYKNLTVKGVGVSVAFVRTVPHAKLELLVPICIDYYAASFQHSDLADTLLHVI